MKSVKSCDKTTSQCAQLFTPGELYRLTDNSGQTALGVGIISNQVAIVDKGDSTWVYGSLGYSLSYKPIHLPNAVIVTNEK